MTRLRQLVVLVIFIAVGCLAGSAVRAEQQTWTGSISDSQCGASHAAMAAHGSKPTDRECTLACVSYGTPDAPKFVLVSQGKVYPIANQRFAALAIHAGERVVVTGEMNDGAITVSKITAAPKK